MCLISPAPFSLSLSSIPVRLHLFICVPSLCRPPRPVPTPPTFFTKVVNSSALQVLWELPSKAGKAEGFRLSYRRVPNADFRGPIQLPCHINAHVVSNLGKRLSDPIFTT